MTIKIWSLDEIEARLRRAMDDFAQEHPEYSGKTARGLCQTASHQFANYLISLEIITPHKWPSGQPPIWAVDEFYFLLGKRYPFGIGPSESHPFPDIYPKNAETNHYVFRLKNLFIDWTARQYKIDAPFPLIWSVKDGAEKD